MAKKFENIKKLTRMDRMILGSTGGDNYNTYYCEDHGFQQKRKDTDNGKCSFSCCASGYKLLTDADIKTLLAL